MEKQRIKRPKFIRKRLLIISALLSGLWAVTATFGQSSNVPQKIQPVENQKLYPKQDIKYEIQIPKVKPANVQLQTPNLSNGIELKTIRKTEYFTEDGGTLLELWYRFDKKGTYSIPRLTLLVNGRRRYFTFEQIKIEEDPANMMPRIVLQFENGITIYSDETVGSKALFTQNVGESIKFTVNLQYTTQLIGFNWEIPQDSIFTQIKAYEFTEIKYREKNYTNELIPVADFEWTVLAKGEIPLPRIHLMATAYKGYRSELITPGLLINFVQNANDTSKTSLKDTMFEAAFDENFKNDIASSKTQISLEDCYKIASLRSEERHNPFSYFVSKKARIDYETALGLPSDQGEFSLGFFYFFATCVLIFSLFLIIFLKKRKTIAVISCSVLLTTSLVMSTYGYVKSFKKTAICKGCSLQSIPEENSNSSSEIGAGNRVIITETTKDWYYIELGTISGWCKKDQVILIK